MSSASKKLLGNPFLRYGGVLLLAALVTAALFWEQRNSEERSEEAEEWRVYRNFEWGFEVQYPPEARLATPDFGIQIDFPLPSDSPFQQQYFRITGRTDVPPQECRPSLLERGAGEEMFVSNGITFFRGFGPSSLLYATERGGRCFLFQAAVEFPEPGGDEPGRVQETQEALLKVSSPLFTFRFLETQ